MFMTFEHAEIPVGALIKGGHSWRYVEYLTSFPYFHVDALDREEDSTRPTVLLIYSVCDLLELAAAGPHGWDLREVQLVSPGHINGTGHWKMDALEAISVSDHGKRKCYAYHLESGVTYYENAYSAGVPREQWRTVYPAVADNKLG